jgi:retinol dehydrogenase 12
MPSFGNFLHTQLILKIPKPTASFTSKTVIITGGNGGLGKEAAKQIVRLGASRVILGCRSLKKGDQAKQEIKASVPGSQTTVEVWDVDLESPPSMKAFVDRASSLPRLDAVISNAGVQLIQFQKTYDTERVVAVNVIGTFLLALQLLPKLSETAKLVNEDTHLTFVGSALYDVAKYPEEHGKDLFAWLGVESNVNMMNQSVSCPNDEYHSLMYCS